MTGTLYFPSFWENVRLGRFSTRSQGDLGLRQSPAGERQEQLRLNATQILSFSSERPQPLYPRQAAGTVRKAQPAHGTGSLCSSHPATSNSLRMSCPEPADSALDGGLATARPATSLNHPTAIPVPTEPRRASLAQPGTAHPHSEAFQPSKE